MSIIGMIIPIDAVSEYDNFQETDVAIARKFWYQAGNSEYSNGGSSEKAPTYRDLSVNSTYNLVTFHNYVEIHDERVETTEYFVEWSIVVYESIDGQQVFIDSKETRNLTYSPPREIWHNQTISINVDCNGAEYHEYYVGSTFKISEIENGELDYIEDPTFFEQAIVYEVDDLPDPTMETSV